MIDYLQKMDSLKIISMCAVVLAFIDTFVVSISITALGLLALGALPWFVHLFKSVELPGGLKLEMRDLQRAEEALVEAGLLEPSPQGDTSPPIEPSVKDPNLALVALRIEIERRLRRLVSNTTLRNSGLPRILRFLQDRHLLSHDQVSALRDLLPLLNSAAHGADVPEDAYGWAMSVGPSLLSSLDSIPDAYETTMY